MYKDENEGSDLITLRRSDPAVMDFIRTAEENKSRFNDLTTVDLILYALDYAWEHMDDFANFVNEKSSKPAK